jgi:hypothetical protein
VPRVNSAIFGVKGQFPLSGSRDHMRGTFPALSVFHLVLNCKSSPSDFATRVFGPIVDPCLESGVISDFARLDSLDPSLNVTASRWSHRARREVVGSAQFEPDRDGNFHRGRVNSTDASVVTQYSVVTQSLAKECRIMDETLRQLYVRYVAALQFYNARLEQRPGRSALTLHVLSKEEFPAWWAAISLERELQERWLERFDDPAAALTRTQQRITEELHRIPIRRPAA